MSYWGHCKDRDRQKWRCPLKVKKSDKNDCQCSTSDYGRVVYTHSKDNLRLFPKTPRCTPTFKRHYDCRTSAERVFKRQKLDFSLAQFKTRSKGRHLFYALLTAIAVHGVWPFCPWFRRRPQTMPAFGFSARKAMARGIQVAASPQSPSTT